MKSAARDSYHIFEICIMCQRFIGTDKIQRERGRAVEQHRQPVIFYAKQNAELCSSADGTIVASR